MWWLPRWLDRLLPNLDIEGAALSRHDDPGDPGDAGGPDDGPKHRQDMEPVLS